MVKSYDTCLFSVYPTMYPSYPRVRVSLTEIIPSFPSLQLFPSFYFLNYIKFIFMTLSRNTTLRNPRRCWKFLWECGVVVWERVEVAGEGLVRRGEGEGMRIRLGIWGLGGRRGLFFRGLLVCLFSTFCLLFSWIAIQKLLTKNIYRYSWSMLTSIFENPSIPVFPFIMSR